MLVVGKSVKHRLSLNRQGLLPCFEQGLQLKGIEKLLLSFLCGENPNSSTVGPYKTVVGMLIASAMCPSAESFDNSVLV